MSKQRTKSGVLAKEALAQGFSQVFGAPGIAYAKAGRLFNGALVEVDEKGDRLEALVIEPAADEPAAVAEIIADPVVAAVADVEPAADEPAADPASVAEPVVDVVPAAESDELAALRATIVAAEADLKGWTADNDASTPAGKKEYAKIYGRVRRAKDAFVKAGGKLD